MEPGQQSLGKEEMEGSVAGARSIAGIAFYFMMSTASANLSSRHRTWCTAQSSAELISTTQNYGDDHGFSKYLVLSSNTAVYMRLNW
jgi:hypothetical protein